MSFLIGSARTTIASLKNGEIGTPGPAGEDGKTSYVHIAYSNSEDGSLDFSTSDSSNRAYIGMYTDFIELDSTDHTKYTWQRTKGEQGESGRDGVAGKDGVGLKNTEVSYAKSTNGQTPPESGWTEQVPVVPGGQFLWTKTTWTYTDNSSESGYSVAKMGQDGNKGDDGIAGKDGVGISETVIEYAPGNDGVTKPTTGWTLSIPTVASGKYLWTRTTWSYTDGTSEVGYTVAKQGEKGDKGDKGDTGRDGIAGKDGVGLRSTSVTYAASTSGTTSPSTGWQEQVPSVAPNNYLWTRTVWTYTDGTSETGYSVAKMGKDGAKGNDGIAGKDGVGIDDTLIEYAVGTSGTIKPTSGWSTTIPVTPQGQYLWTRTTWTYTDNTTEQGFTVSRQGEKGDKGDQGIAGPKGADGRTQYTHIAYADNASGGGFSQNPTGKAYIGMYVDFEELDSSDPTRYAWSLIKGADGEQGVAGPKGEDGRTPYFHTAYTNSTDFGAYDYSGNPNLMRVIKASDFNKESDVSVSDVGYNSIRLTSQGVNRLSAFTSNNIPSLVSGKTYTISAKVKIEEGTTGNIDKFRVSYRKTNSGTILLYAITKGVEVGKEITIKGTGVVNYEITDLSRFYLTIDTEVGATINGGVIVSDIKIEEGSEATPYQPNLLDAPHYFSKVALGENLIKPESQQPVTNSNYLIKTYNTKPMVKGKKYTITLEGTKPATQVFRPFFTRDTGSPWGFGDLKPVEGLTDIWSATFTAAADSHPTSPQVQIYQVPSTSLGQCTIKWLKLEEGDTRTPNIDYYKYLGNYTDFVQEDSLNPTKYSWSLIKGADGETSHVHTAYAWSEDGADRFTKVYPQVNMLENTKNPTATKTPRIKGSSPSGTDTLIFQNGITHHERKTIPSNGEMFYRFMSTTDGNLASTNLVKGETYYFGLDLRAELAEGDYVTWRAQYKKSTGSWIDFDGWKTGLSKIEGVTSEFKRFENALTIPKDAMTMYFSYQVYPKSGTGVAIGSIVEFKNAKFALKSATPYTPTSEEDYENAYPTYTGTYSDFNVEGSNNPKDYTWVRSMGNTGAKGDDGIAGKDGVGLKSTAISYVGSANGTTPPSTGWQTQVPTVPAGQFLWTRTIWTYTDNSNETGYSVAKMGQDGAKGNDGIAGKDGVGIKTTLIEYAVSTSGTTHPISGWSSSIPSIPPGQYLWTRTTWTYTDNTTEQGFTVARQGSNGQNGTNGTNGKPAFFHTAWANSPDGTLNFSKTDSLNKSYMGTYSDDVQEGSNDPSKYKWTELVGALVIDSTNYALESRYNWRPRQSSAVESYYNILLDKPIPKGTKIQVGTDYSWVSGNKPTVDGIRMIAITSDGSHAGVELNLKTAPDSGTITISGTLTAEMSAIRLYNGSSGKGQNNIYQFENTVVNIGDKLCGWQPNYKDTPQRNNLLTNSTGQLGDGNWIIPVNTWEILSPEKDKPTSNIFHSKGSTSINDMIYQNPHPIQVKSGQIIVVSFDYKENASCGNMFSIRNFVEPNKGLAAAEAQENWDVPRSLLEKSIQDEWIRVTYRLLVRKDGYLDFILSNRSANASAQNWFREIMVTTNGSLQGDYSWYQPDYTSSAVNEANQTIPRVYVQSLAPQKVKDGDQWWKMNNNKITNYYVYGGGKWNEQTIDQSVLNIATLNAVNINGSVVAGSTFVNEYTNVQSGLNQVTDGSLKIENGILQAGASYYLTNDQGERLYKFATTDADIHQGTVNLRQRLYDESGTQTSESTTGISGGLITLSLSDSSGNYHGVLDAKALTRTPWKALQLDTNMYTVAENNPPMYRIIYNLDGSKTVKFKGQFMLKSGNMKAGTEYYPFRKNGAGNATLLPAEIRPNQTEFGFAAAGVPRGQVENAGGRIGMTTTPSMVISPGIKEAVYFGISSLTYDIV